MKRAVILAAIVLAGPGTARADVVAVAPGDTFRMECEEAPPPGHLGGLESVTVQAHRLVVDFRGDYVDSTHRVKGARFRLRVNSDRVRVDNTGRHAAVYVDVVCAPTPPS